MIKFNNEITFLKFVLQGRANEIVEHLVKLRNADEGYEVKYNICNSALFRHLKHSNKLRHNLKGTLHVGDHEWLEKWSELSGILLQKYVFFNSPMDLLIETQVKKQRTDGLTKHDTKWFEQWISFVAESRIGHQTNEDHLDTEENAGII
jgi:hypothetical protein